MRGGGRSNDPSDEDLVKEALVESPVASVCALHLLAHEPLATSTSWSSIPCTFFGFVNKLK
jgi:hypothetical protein